MTVGLAVATVAGGFTFPFLVRMMWGRMVENWGPIGGWMAAGFIIGLAFLYNHALADFTPGKATPAIYQTGAWVDMAWAAGIGLIVATVILGGSLKKAVPNIISSVIGGTLAGLVLSLFL